MDITIIKVETNSIHINKLVGAESNLYSMFSSRLIQNSPSPEGTLKEKIIVLHNM